MLTSVSRYWRPPMVTHIGTTVTPRSRAISAGSEHAPSVTIATLSALPPCARHRPAHPPRPPW